MNLKNMLSEKDQKRVHLYEVSEQAKLVCSLRNQISGYLRLVVGGEEFNCNGTGGNLLW